MSNILERQIRLSSAFVLAHHSLLSHHAICCAVVKRESKPSTETEASDAFHTIGGLTPLVATILLLLLLFSPVVTKENVLSSPAVCAVMVTLPVMSVHPLL